MSKPARLYLKDGKSFNGAAPSWQTGAYEGEVVFNTGMTGYVESLTDPSYAGQILVFTYPMIGNYGVESASAESDKIQASGVVVSEAAAQWSHSKAQQSLLQWLELQKIPIIYGVDARALTKHLRKEGSMQGAIGGTRKPVFTPPKPAFVTIKKPRLYNTKNKKKVILVDCGAKENILRSLLDLQLQVKRVPCDYDYSGEDYDGVLLSNGPGNPEVYKDTVKIARKALKSSKPIFGICLGTQIMALAAGARTYKLKFGHRGHNQPCLAADKKRAYITSQNHGYSIDEGSLPKDWSVLFHNLNDNSVEGIEHKSKPFFSVQFHPEACPGPTDTTWLFKKFYDSL